MLNSQHLEHISSDTQHLLEEQLSSRIQLRNARTISQSQPTIPNWTFDYAYHTSIGTMVILKERPTKKFFAHDAKGFWGLRLQIRIRCGSWRKRISFLLFKERHGMTGTLRCIWTHQGVLPPQSQIFQHTRNGDLRTIQSMFHLHEATPFDTTPDGVTLLHVSKYRNSYTHTIR